MSVAALIRRTVLRSRPSFVLGAATALASFALAGHAGAQTVDHAMYLHTVCKAAAEGPNTVIVTDSGQECIFKTAAGNGTSTFYNYFSGASGNDYCVRTVVVVPGAPAYDRTTCGSLPEDKNLYQGITQSTILDELKGADEAIRIVGEKTEYVEGSVQLLRKGGTMPVTADIPVEDGDVVLTGKTGFVDIISTNDAVWLSGDSNVGFAGIDPKEPKRVIAPDEPLDPQNFQLDELSWWEKISLRLAGSYNPDVYKTAEMYGFKKARIVYRGAAYFEEKTDGTSTPAMVVTPTAAIVPNGTSFLVEVDKDGTTTVTTLAGKVLVEDLKSGAAVSVGVNQAVTVPKTARGSTVRQLQGSITTVFLKPIDRWWFEKMTERDRQAALKADQAGARAAEAAGKAMDFKNKAFFAGLAIVFVVGIIVSSVIRARASGKK